MTRREAAIGSVWLASALAGCVDAVTPVPDDVPASFPDVPIAPDAPDGSNDVQCADDAMNCCHGVVVDLQSEPNSCGECYFRCPTAHASSRCEQGACVTVCDRGFEHCAASAGECVPVLTSDPLHCGACGHACEAGTPCVAGECTGTAPRLISPLSTSRIASHRPLLRWTPPAGGGPVVVEVCSSRDCHEIEGSQSVPTDVEIRWEAALAPGPHWWRLRRGAGPDRRPSATWEFFIEERDTPVPLIVGWVDDFNGDGAEDSLTMGACPPASSCAGVIYGHAPGAARLEATTIRSPMNRSGTSTGPSTPPFEYRYEFRAIGSSGDFNGDGFADLWASLWSYERRGFNLSDGAHVTVYAGSLPGIPSEASGACPTCTSLYAASYASQAGDVDGDGYADLIVDNRPSPYGLFYGVMFGAPRGPIEQAHIAGWPTWSTFSRGNAVEDFNGDGMIDFVAASYEATGFQLSIHMGARGDRSLRFHPLDCGPTRLHEIGTSITSIASWNDLDADGYPDLTLAVRESFDRMPNPTILTWLGGPDGLTAARCTITPPAP